MDKYATRSDVYIFVAARCTVYNCARLSTVHQRKRACKMPPPQNFSESSYVRVIFFEAGGSLSTAPTWLFCVPEARWGGDIQGSRVYRSDLRIICRDSDFLQQ